MEPSGFIKNLIDRFSTEGLYYKSNVARVKWNAPRKVAILKWQKRAKAEKFRQACLKNLELAEAHQSQIWYENRVALNKITDEDQHWFEQEFAQRLYAKGIKRMAFLISEKTYQRKKHTQWLYGTNQYGIEYRYFNKVFDAVTWLLELRKEKGL